MGTGPNLAFRVATLCESSTGLEGREAPSHPVIGSRLGRGHAASCLGSGPFDALGIGFPTDWSPFGR